MGTDFRAPFLMRFPFSGLFYLIASVQVFQHLKSLRVGLWQNNARTHNPGEITRGTQQFKIIYEMITVDDKKSN